MRDDASEASYSSWGDGGAAHQPSLGGSASEQGQHLHSSVVELSRELNRQITQASTMQELMHVVVVNFSKLNAVRGLGVCSTA